MAQHMKQLTCTSQSCQCLEQNSLPASCRSPSPLVIPPVYLEAQHSMRRGQSCMAVEGPPNGPEWVGHPPRVDTGLLCPLYCCQEELSGFHALSRITCTGPICCQLPDHGWLLSLSDHCSCQTIVFVISQSAVIFNSVPAFGCTSACKKRSASSCCLHVSQCHMHPAQAWLVPKLMTNANRNSLCLNHQLNAW